MDSTTVNQPGTVAIEPPSTVLNPETAKTPSGGGQPSLREDNSLESVLESELARLKEEDAKQPEKAKEKVEDEKKSEAEKAPNDEKGAKDNPEKGKEGDKSDKPAPAKDEKGRFTKAEKESAEAEADKPAAEKPAAGQDGTDRRQSEGRHPEPPARFLPEARTKWANVPHEVKAEVHRVAQEYEAEIAKHKAASDFYESMREFDELARRTGTTVPDALRRYVGLEQTLRQNPAQGIAEVLRNVGLTPQQYAEHVMKNPQAHVVPARPQRPAQTAPEVQMLAREVSDLKAQLATASIAPVVQNFAAAHPDFDALEPQIAAILHSKVIDKIYGTGLTLEQKLTQAYRMAGGSTPPSRSAPEPLPAHSDSPSAPSQGAGPKPSPDAGTKSIRGAPSDGHDPAVEDDETDIREVLRKEFRRIAS